MSSTRFIVTPAKAGVQSPTMFCLGGMGAWIPAFAGMTVSEFEL
jgi:hypothetical protein